MKRVTTLLAALLASALSSCERRDQPEPTGGEDYSYGLPLNEGDVYELNTGLRIQVELAPEVDGGAAPVMRLVFEGWRFRKGFYLSHHPDYGTLVYGEFDGEQLHTVRAVVGGVLYGG